MEKLTYEEFIDNILKTRGRFACGDEYHERHHIVPKCIGGTNDKNNLIDLFAREHFIAHKLLAQENPHEDSLIYAWWCMSHLEGQDHERYELSPEEYEEVKIVYSKMMSERMTGKNNPMYGVHMRGEDSPFFGKRHTEEVKKQMSEYAKQRFSIPENNPMYGKHHTEETKEKIRQKNIGKKSGEDNPFYGKKHTEETRRRMSESAKGKHKRENLSESTIKKMSENAKLRIGALNYVSKAVIRLSDLKIYECMSDAAKDNGVSRTTIRRWCEKGVDWMYLKDKEEVNELQTI